MMIVGGSGLTFEELVDETGCMISFEQVSMPSGEGINLQILVNKAEEGWHLRVQSQPDIEVKTYQIDFPYYVTFLTAVDDHTRWNDRERFRGNAFRIYEQTPFLEYLKNDFLSSTNFIGKELTLYGLACIDHIVYIASYVEPIVKEISLENEGK